MRLLLIISLEYDDIRQLAGERAVRVVIERKPYYKWMYQQILADLEFFDQLVNKHKLKI